MTGQRAAKPSLPSTEAKAPEAARACPPPSSPVSDARYQQTLVQRAADEGRLDGTRGGVVVMRVGLLALVVIGCAAAWMALAGMFTRALT